MHTNQTPNLGLSQFVGTDKPTWLGDYNDDMAKIDEGVGGAAANAESASQSAANAAQSAAKAVSDVADLSLKVANYDTQIANAQTDATQAKADAQNALNTANGLSSQVTAAATAAQTAQQTATSAQGTAQQALTNAATAQQRADDAYALASQGGDSYVLPTATSSRLGGVKIGSGVNVSADGTISVDTSGGGGTPGSNSITTDMLQNSCVTANKLATSAVTSETVQSGAITGGKLANGAVQMANLDSSIQSILNNIPEGNVEMEVLYSGSGGQGANSATLNKSISNFDAVIFIVSDSQGRNISNIGYNNNSSSITFNPARTIYSSSLNQYFLDSNIATISGTTVSIADGRQLWCDMTTMEWHDTELTDLGIKTVIGVKF